MELQPDPLGAGTSPLSRQIPATVQFGFARLAMMADFLFKDF